jgi:hypothetical protein
MGNLINYNGANLVSYTPVITPPDIAKVQGVSQLLGVPTPLRVMLQDRRDGKVLRHWVTPANGVYDFNVSNLYLGHTDLMLIAFDDNNGLSADIVDHIEPTNG